MSELKEDRDTDAPVSGLSDSNPGPTSPASGSLRQDTDEDQDTAHKSWESGTQTEAYVALSVMGVKEREGVKFTPSANFAAERVG